MNLHEFQAKQWLREFGVPTPKGEAASSVAEALAAANKLGGQAWVVKAQVHAGGRGKAGGVRIARSLDEVEGLAASMLGKPLVTRQNAPDGQPVKKVLVEETLAIARELYLSILVDREAERIAVVASAAGGMDIEEVAGASPERILKAHCDPINGLMPYQCRDLAFRLGLKAEAFGDFCTLLPQLYRLFVESDLALLEINPLVVTQENRVLPLDCKMSVDDNALYRQKALADLNDVSQIDPKEAAAHQAGINYIALAGNIGCMVNGAGLAMATMDLIKLHGGEPANFLDVGGGATADTVAKAFKIILADSKVRAVLVNIFGGIMRCDIIAEGIITAIREVGVQIPVVVRLEGTNVDVGKQKLKDSGLAVITADDLTDAAKQAVASVN
ncbi:MAG TPA: ADP-forming succinate--CoA ligase subunit beta [Thiobacillaceae bacterium]|nr:ADP-forming succinate--CoA ligase subunit beta [Thiobacillaceae bacterium]